MKNSMLRNLRALRDDRQGIIAVFVALSVPILVGSAAFAVDFTNYRIVASRLQSAADAGALAGVRALDKPAVSVSEAVRFAGLNVPESFGNVTLASDVTIGKYSKPGLSSEGAFVAGIGPDANAVRVNAVRTPERGNATKRILSVFWGPDEVSLGAQATAARQLNVQYEPPERMLLDNVAWDYNEVYAYCYDNSSKTRIAGTETLIGNNIMIGEAYKGETVTYNGKTIKKGATIKSASDIITISKGKITKIADDPIKWPECTKQGQSLSFRLRNIREVKQYPDKWANAAQYNYYTDTVITAGVESFPGLPQEQNKKMLETVRCDSLDACKPGSSGIPSKQSNRNPKEEAKPCLPGKFMYFGWEDRPATDRDYNDITMVMKCPKSGILGDGKTRLVG